MAYVYLGCNSHDTLLFGNTRGGRMMWSVYLIATAKRTYVGCTTDPMRRLRQHNREIRGGARATKHGAGEWQFVVYVTGFPNRSSACRWEAIVKKRARGLKQRMAALIDVAQGRCPEGRGRKYTPPKKLTIYSAQEAA